MSDLIKSNGANDREYANISTGDLPQAEQVQALVDEAHRRFLSETGGVNSAVYPALQRADPNRFGVCVVGANGAVFEAGDAGVEFSIMSVVKPFALALVSQEIGPEEVHRLIGVNATGLAFNSLSAIEHGVGGRTNPMVNSGAIATVSLVPGATVDEKWANLHGVLSRFAGRDLAIDEEVYASASATNHRNQAIARLLEAVGAIYWDPSETVDLYTRQCSLAVSARDLAVMGATLACGGVNPLTREQVVDAATCHDVLAVMVIAGLYETSGDWRCIRWVCRVRAALAAASSPCRLARVGSQRIRRRSTPPATACAGRRSRAISRGISVLISSYRRNRSDPAIAHRNTTSSKALERRSPN